MPFLIDDLVHSGGVRLLYVVADVEHAETQRPFAEGDLHDVALLYRVGGAGDLAVDPDALGVAGLVGDGTPLDHAGDLKEFVKPHFSKTEK